MSRFSFIVCALIASATCAARPMVIHQSQTLEPPPGSGYYFFGYEVAIDGDWAIVAAATPSPTPASPQQTHDALLYHRVNGTWVFDRTLSHLVSTDYSQYVQFWSMAMSNGAAAIRSGPTQIFKRTGATWAEIAHPFTAPQGDPNFVDGDLLWDGNTLLAAQATCDYNQQRSWGALISRLNSDASWTPLERLSAGYTACSQQPMHWGISGNTAVAATRTSDYEVEPDQLYIFRRSGTTWVPTSTINGGMGEGDVRGDEIFLSHAAAGPGTLVYRNDDNKTVVDNVRTVSASFNDEGRGYGFTHTNDVFVQRNDLFRKNTAGKYEHVATLVPDKGDFTLVDGLKVNGRRLISPAWRDHDSSNRVALIFDLPATYTPSRVISTGFETGVPAFRPQAGTFAVATRGSGNHVYRQSSQTGSYRAVLSGSDWVEQSIEVDFRPTAFSGAGSWVGLAVRFLDSANHYYVTLGSSGTAELRRMRAGISTVLAQKPMPLVAGQYYHVALQAFGSEIRVLVNGKEFLWALDRQPIPHGNTALLGVGATVDYDNVVAAQVGQRPIFDLLDAGCNGPLINSPVWTGDGTGNWYCAYETGPNVMQQRATEGVARAIVGTPTDDQVVTTRVRATAFGGSGTQDHWFGVVARYTDSSNYYYLALRDSNTVSLRKLVNGTITVLGTAPRPVGLNSWYNLRLDAVGNELRAFINGAQVLQVVDTSHASGQGGILTYKTAAEFVSYYAWQP